jgi:hypothetical protein
MVGGADEKLDWPGGRPCKGVLVEVKVFESLEGTSHAPVQVIDDITAHPGGTLAPKSADGALGT